MAMSLCCGEEAGLTRTFAILTGLPDDMFAEEREDKPPQRALMPPRYLLDTNICIYIRRQQPRKVLARFQKLRPGAAAISASPTASCFLAQKRARIVRGFAAVGVTDRLLASPLSTARDSKRLRSH